VRDKFSADNNLPCLMIHWDQFDRIYLISLADRRERRRHALKQIARFIGTDLPQLQVFDAIRPTESAGFPNAGARGCFLSHLDVLKQALASGYERILVLEDDIYFNPSVLSVELPPEWGLVYLGHSLPALTPTRVEHYSGQVLMTHCYAVSGVVLPLLVRYLDAMLLRPPGDPRGGPMPIDCAFNWFRAANPQASTWVALPSICRQAPFPSDITARRWFDRAPLIRQVLFSARSFKRQLSLAQSR